jgi:hypothetical protein
MNTTSEIAKAAGITPRTKRFVLHDEYGFAYPGTRTDHVLAALQRTDLVQLDRRTFTVACALRKCYVTGRMNVELARRVREQKTPYQLCAMVAKIAELWEGDESQGVGDLADILINKWADQL